MSATPDAVMRQWFQEVWNERREQTIDELMAPDAKVHGLAGGVIEGPEGFKPFHRAFCGAFADLGSTSCRPSWKATASPHTVT